MDGDGIMNKYTQVITKTGRKIRFVGSVVPIDGFDPETDIAHQKELTEDEILKIPEVKSGKLIMRDKNAEELAAEQSTKDTDIELAAIEKKISDGIRSEAITKYLTTEEVEKIGG